MPLNPTVADMVSRITRFGTAPANRYSIDFSNSYSGIKIIQSVLLTKRLSASLESVSIPRCWNSFKPTAIQFRS